jgi:S-adenosylmethionine:tRNA ribosyltransferase-isomerase
MPYQTVDHLQLSAFDYDLPQSLIAQEPGPERDRSRLLILDRRTGTMDHRVFADLIEHLRGSDVLVLNNTRVFPCRLLTQKAGGGEAEVFLLEEVGLNLWHALVRGSLGPGKRVALVEGIEAEIVGKDGAGVATVRFHGVPDIRARLDDIGSTPLPPYIKRQPDAQDRDRYQTVYAAREGAVAAPTAGLHFTERLLGMMQDRGVEVVMVTLHVGPGTFQPVRTSNITDHRLLPERYEITAAAAVAINRAKAEGRRIIAVGSTCVRTLETVAQEDGSIRPGTGNSGLFIYPGYAFRVVDGMITNFHLPRSTLLMLATAFGGYEQVMAAYRTAVMRRYRFYSYGDAMCIL